MFRFALGIIVGVCLTNLYPRQTREVLDWAQHSGADLMQQGAERLRSQPIAPSVTFSQDDSQQPYRPADSRYQAVGRPVPLHDYRSN